MKLTNPLDEIGFFPSATGDVLCIHCQQADNINRKGHNPLIGCEPEGSARLYIHALELNAYAPRPHQFIELFYRALAAATHGETSH